MITWGSQALRRWRTASKCPTWKETISDPSGFSSFVKKEQEEAPDHLRLRVQNLLRTVSLLQGRTSAFDAGFAKIH